MIQLLDFLKGTTGSYGFAIIVFSFIVKLALYYPTQSQYKSMKDMQKIQPEMKKLQEKYKNDQQKLQMETMALYKKYNVNPLAGCLPLLIQMPILIGIYSTINQMAKLGKFSSEVFLWIGGPLSKTYAWLGTSLADKDIPLLIVYGISMFLSQKMSMTPGGDPAAEKTQQIMAYAMPVFLMFVLWNLPSSLILYWLVFNILTIVQQYFIMKSSDDENNNVPGQQVEETQIPATSEVGFGSSIQALQTGGSLSRSRKKKGGKIK
jgi:YidC/Oxa1 family membrane protein insertase